MKKIFSYILAAFLVFQAAGIAHGQTLDELQQRQAELDQQIQANRNALNSKQQQVNDLQGVVNSLDNQITTTQKDIDLSTKKIDLTTEQINALEAQIAQKEKELQTQKDNLNEAIRTMYEMPNQSTVEIVVGSNSLSEIVDKSQYIESVQYSIEQTINKINQLKSELENQRNQLDKQRSDLQTQKNSLVEKRKGLDLQKAEKDKLLNQNVAEKNGYQDTLSKLMSERSHISSEIYAQRRGQGQIYYGTSDYPFGNIDIPDPWSFLTRECTSYAAWYWNAKEGKNWYNTQPGRGSARYWDEIAHTLGYTVSSSPQIGGFVVWRGPLYAGDQWGHVAIVEAINPDGSINVSEMNWISYSYSYRSNINPGNWGSYYYIY